MSALEASDVLLAVWQETCRHIQLPESTVTIAAMLAEHLPLDVLLVRELDIKRSRLETVASSAVRQGDVALAGGAQCSAAQLARLLAWSRHGKVAHGQAEASADAEWAICLPPGATGEALVGPLTSPQSTEGVLVVLSRRGRSFEPAHVALVGALLDPFSIALGNHRRLRELQALREAAEAEKRSLLTRLGRTDSAEAIVGLDAGLQQVMERVELVARSDVPVLILGETGAGKEVIARAIHTRSPRAAGPFIRVNCGAVPADLIDSQLFGHERGSFTGAIDSRKGWFERADGGTLFLDEIGDLPPAAQVRLLRVLQDGYLERVGGQQSLKVDTRIVTATHRDLTTMVRDGRFREDLWYRIAVFPVLLPPLRERPQDIPALARHFAARAAVRFGLPEQMPSPTDMAALVAYPWPGNVRELAAVIDRAAILGDGQRLEVASALGVVPAPAPAVEASPADRRPPAPTPEALTTLESALRRHIEAALAATLGRVEGAAGAARLLGVNPHTLRARMRKLGIDWASFRLRPFAGPAGGPVTPSGTSAGAPEARTSD